MGSVVFGIWYRLTAKPFYNKPCFEHGNKSAQVGISSHLSYLDDEGLSLYIFMDDTQHGESSSCNDECAAQWPPLLSQGSPIAGEGVDSTLLGTVTRADGTLQVIYNG